MPTATSPASPRGFVDSLRARGPEGLVALLEARPDLAAPPPSTLRSLAARATGRPSLERALASVDAQGVQVLEAVLALTDHAPTTLAAVRQATGADDGVARCVAHARTLALLHGDDDALLPAPGLGEVLGPYPAGLGPSLTTTLARRSPDALEELARRVGADGDGADGVGGADIAALAAHLGRRDVVVGLLEQAPPGARSVLDALLWGPPVGVSPGGGEAARGPQERTPARVAVDWLLRHGLLAGSDGQHVLLPREPALALRDGRTHRAPATAPAPAGSPRDDGTVAAESAAHAQELVRRTALLLEAWGEDPPSALRSGGLGARELRRTAQRLGVSEAEAALVIEVAGAADLVASDEEEPAALVPTTAADDWLALPLTERWASLVLAWFGSERVAWLVGTRDERGSLRPALDPEGRRPWAPRLRRQVLDVVAGQTLVALAPAEVTEVLHWRTPRNAPAEHAVGAVLAEAGTLGVLGAGALSPAGRALLDGSHAGPPTAADIAPLAEALAAQLPPPVDEVMLQGDLTGIVPGRPSEDLAELLDLTADVESRGAALTVRFAEATVRRALDAGRTGEDVLAALSRHARSGVPQPLEYLVLDTARRHGRLRVGAAASYVRAEDPGLLAGLAEETALRGLGLVLLAPTVLAAQVPPAQLLAALRERGLSPVAEDSSGTVVVLGPGAARIRVPRDRRRARTVVVPPGEAAAAQGRRLIRLANDLLRGAPADDDDAPPPGPLGTAAARAAGDARDGTPDPVTALDQLREAAADGATVWIELVDGSGRLVRRRVRPLRVEGGRVRALDPDREAELTVAVHRIAAVLPDPLPDSKESP